MILEALSILSHWYVVRVYYEQKKCWLVKIRLKSEKIHIEPPGSAFEESLALKIEQIFVVRSLLRMSFSIWKKNGCGCPCGFCSEQVHFRKFSIITGWP